MKICQSTIFIVYCSIFIQQILARYLLVEIDSKQPTTTKGPLQCIFGSLWNAGKENLDLDTKTCVPPYDNSCIWLDFGTRTIQDCSDIDFLNNICFVSNLMQLCYCDTDLCNAVCEPVWESCKETTKTNPIVEELLTKYDIQHYPMKECKANCDPPMEKN